MTITACAPRCNVICDLYVSAMHHATTDVNGLLLSEFKVQNP
jgi:hypothetical protein